ncbi:hypothetical protein GE061_016717 [Apolygus lucorum]|uniref:WD repeat-containing protein 76 n=1 Tax=Apolygus lucorum TaxID=248454 RepID=A0A8S9XGZ3_APOLU|nr:hypothetical protein GE061_016717 [Apolygus lucorum]
MATSRRSSRAKQVVDYAKLLEGDSEADDTFISNSKKRRRGEHRERSPVDSAVGPAEEECQEEEVNPKDEDESTTWVSAELSEYEKTIMKNIEERNRFMVALGFPEAVKDLKACLPVKVEQEKPKTKRSRPSLPKEVLPPREPSRRLRNMAAASKVEVAEDEEKENHVKTDDRLLGTMEMEEGLKVEVNCDVSYNPDLDLSACDIVQYKHQLTSMKFLKLARMNTSRIQSLHVHQSMPNPLIFSGDKYGNFSIWRPNCAEDAKDEVITHSAHRGGLNCISTSLEDKSVLYTTGYDGTILKVEMNKGQFTNIFATDFEDDVSHITWHDEFEPRRFLVAHGRGDVGILDASAGKTVQKWIDCFPRSVKTVQHHPTQSHYFVAASGTGNVKIFDVRNPKECVTEEIHGRSVSSAFFSPDGNSLLTNSFDDHVRVFDTSVISMSLKKTASYVHNNHTGRWLTPFKAVWVPQRNDVFHIGSMLNNPRRVRFYTANSEGVLMDLIDYDNLEYICSTQAMHPQLPLIACANSSGKLTDDRDRFYIVPSQSVLQLQLTPKKSLKNGDNPHNKEHKSLEVLGKYSLRYLTNWTFGLQMIYFAVSVLGHLLGVIGASRLKNKIHGVSDYMFMAIATPMALVVSIVFWALYSIDRELVFPKVLDLVIPVWVNQSIHSINAICAIIDIFIINHRVPSGKSSIVGLLTYLLAYAVCLFGTYFQTGIWLYPVLKELNWPMRVAFALSTVVIALLTLGFTRVLQSMIWGKTPAGGAEKKKKATKQKKK